MDRKADLHIGQKIRKAFYCTLVFGFLCYNGTFKLVASLISYVSSSNEELIDGYGHPTIKAVFIQMILFFAIVVMFII